MIKTINNANCLLMLLFKEMLQKGIILSLLLGLSVIAEEAGKRMDEQVLLPIAPLVTGVRGSYRLTLLNVLKGFCASQNAGMKSAHQGTGAEEVNWSEMKRLIRGTVHLGNNQ